MVEVQTVREKVPATQQLCGFRARTDARDVRVVLAADGQSDVLPGTEHAGDPYVLHQVPFVVHVEAADIEPVRESPTEVLRPVPGRELSYGLVRVLDDDGDVVRRSQVSVRHVAEARVLRLVVLALHEHVVVRAEAVVEQQAVVLILHARVVDLGLSVQRDVAEATRRREVVLRVPVRSAAPESHLPDPAEQVHGRPQLLALVPVHERDPAAVHVAAAERGNVGRPQVDHSTNRVRAVQDGRRSANHLHLRDVVHIHDRGQLAEILLAAGIVETQAVLEEKDPLSALAPNRGPRLVGSDAVDVDSGKALQRIRRRVRRDGPESHGVEDGNRRRDDEQLLRVPRGRHGNRLHDDRLDGGAVRFSFGGFLREYGFWSRKEERKE